MWFVVLCCVVLGGGWCVGWLDGLVRYFMGFGMREVEEERQQLTRTFSDLVIPVSETDDLIRLSSALDSTTMFGCGTTID